MSSFWEKQDLLISVEKNKKEKVIATKCLRKGIDYLDIRIYTKNQEDAYIPTSKGITLSYDVALPFLEDLIKEIK